MTVAAMANRIIKRLNDCCWLKAMRRAIKPEILNENSFYEPKIGLSAGYA